MRRTPALALMTLSLSLSGAMAASVNLNHVQFPERREVALSFVPAKRIPGAMMTGKVTFEDRQAWIEISYEKMKPAVLFGGDIASYVLWTIARDGSYENLGELWVAQDKDKDSVKFSTGLRGFALLVTAEPYYQVKKPSGFIITYNSASIDAQAPSSTFEFSNLAEAPRSGFDDLAAVKYDSSNVLDLIQAQKAYDLAARLGATEFAPVLYRDAGIALAQAQKMQSGGARKGAGDFSRRSYALTNEAIKVTLARLDERALEEQMNKRRAEVAAMEKRVSDAEAQAKQKSDEARKAGEQANQMRLEAEKTRAQAEESRRQADEAAQELARTREEMKSAEADRRRIENEKNQLAQVMEELRTERGVLEKSMEALKEEKAVLGGRLQDALSKVADTQQSARGLIVNLPDILFAVSKAELKPEASLVLAKLAGILLIMQDLNLRIEGHTDSTGAASYNQKLSQQRADSVMDFLGKQGISSARMKSVGYGPDRPVADNNSAEGRQKNRRVELIIAEGEIQAQPPSD